MLVLERRTDTSLSLTLVVHSLQVALNKKYSRGWRAQVSFTFSRSVDESSGINSQDFSNVVQYGMDWYDPARPDYPFMRRLEPWNFRCDPTGQSLQPEDVWWCAFRSMHPLEHLKRNPNTINRQDLRPTHTWAGKKIGGDFRPGASPEAVDIGGRVGIAASSGLSNRPLTVYC